MAPTIHREGPYRFFFYSSDGGEPALVHVQCEDRVAKFWLRPVRLAARGAFSRSEVADLRRRVERHGKRFEESWDEHFRPGRR